LAAPLAFQPQLAGLRLDFALRNCQTMSLAEIKKAVTELSPEELAELAAFVQERESGAWDRQIDGDFAEGGRLRRVLEEVRADIRAGQLEELP
jgi:hypothetical protein